MIDWNKELTPGLREWFRVRNTQIWKWLTAFYWLMQLIPLAFIIQDLSRLGWGGVVRGSQLSRIGVWMPVAGLLIGLGLMGHCLFLAIRRKLGDHKETFGCVVLAAIGTESAFKVMRKVLETQSEGLSRSGSVDVQARFVFAVGVCVVWIWIWAKLIRHYPLRQSSLVLDQQTRDSELVPDSPASQSTP